MALRLCTFKILKKEIVMKHAFQTSFCGSMETRKLQEGCHQSAGGHNYKKKGVLAEDSKQEFKTHI